MARAGQIHTDIRDPSLVGVLWNWKPVSDLLPGKAGVSDIDGVIERRGRFLFIESKHPGERLSTGQFIMLRNLAVLDEEKVRVVIAYGDRTTGIIEYYKRVTRKGLGVKQTGEEFNAAVKSWFSQASRGRRGDDSDQNSTD